MNDFLQKISPVFGGKQYLIPPSKLSIQQREQRRLAYRNERNLYKHESALSQEEIVSFYHPTSPLKIYSHDEWWADDWDPMKYGLDFDFGRGFFEQFYEMQLEVPRPPLVNNKAHNSPYCNFADSSKNCHLITSGNQNEECYYDFFLVKCNSCVDSLWVINCELCYQCVDCQGCYNVRYAQECDGCVDCSFVHGCRSCNNCILCVNLRGKKYHVLNKPVSKEEYDKVMAEIHGDHMKYQRMLEQFEKLKQEFPVRKAANFVKSENVSGDNIFQSRNIHLGFDIYTSEDCAYIHDGLNGKDCQDICFFDGVELCYESTSLIGYGYRFTNACRDSVDLFYCDNCHGCKNCFGCVGLRKKEYCIFNKQYSREEYEQLCGRIIDHMSTLGEWGEFFPTKYSLFAYNETLAQDYFPLTKEQALEYGWKWLAEDPSEFKPQSIVLPNNISEVKNSIVGETLACEVTGKNYQIISQELDFYRKMGLPLPRKHPDTRTQERLTLRTGRVLRNTVCGKCGIAVKTPRSCEVLCEECYLGEVY